MGCPIWHGECYQHHILFRGKPIAIGGKCTWETVSMEGKEILCAYRLDTENGSIGRGLYQNVQGARLLYTPPEGMYGDMTLHLKADPAKTAGQGFGSAGQYMDICIKFDTMTLSGYGLRIIRTKEAADGVTFVLVKYDKGNVHYLQNGILTSCYRTDCHITLEVKGNRLRAHGVSGTRRGSGQKTKHAPMADLSSEIESSLFGGIAIQHTGTPGAGGWQNTTMLHSLEVEWQKL